MEPIAHHRSRLVFRLMLLVSGLHLVSACWHVLHGGLNSDEGFYALAARSVWQGEMPYRDFGYTQMPLLPYINGLLMQFTGFGLFEQRAINGLWGALALVLAALWLKRRTSVQWALGFIALFSVSAPWMYFIHLGKTYAFTGLVAVAALWVYTEAASSVRKVAVLALLGTIGAGCRLPAAPYFALLWLAAALDLVHHPKCEWWRAAAYSLLWPILLIVPFYLEAPEAAYFWTLDFHRIAVRARTQHLPWRDLVLLAPALWLAIASGLLLNARRSLWPGRRDLGLIAATLIALAMNLLPEGAFEEYAVPLLLPLAVTAAMLLWRAGSSIRWLRHGLVPVALLFANLGLTVAVQWPYLQPEQHSSWSMFVPVTIAPYDRGLPESLARARAVVNRALPPDRPFIGPQLILAAETGHPVPRNLRMGGCSSTVDFPSEKSRHLNLATLQDVEAYFTDADQPLLALSKNPSANYGCSIPTFRNSAQFRSFVWNEYFQQHFLVAYEDDEILLLVRKP